VKLYTLEVLSLATSLSAWPYDPAMPFHGKARSQSCGSSLALSLQVGSKGQISGLGIAAQACAIGQASAALFAQSAIGQRRDDLAQAAAALDAWLHGKANLPDWPGLSALSAVQAYPSRHGAMLLAWRAALDALP
jgi:NifU-like protein involved in Fe-S cluster formation